MVLNPHYLGRILLPLRPVEFFVVFWNREIQLIQKLSMKIFEISAKIKYIDRTMVLQTLWFGWVRPLSRFC